MKKESAARACVAGRNGAPGAGGMEEGEGRGQEKFGIGTGSIEHRTLQPAVKKVPAGHGHHEGEIVVDCDQGGLRTDHVHPAGGRREAAPALLSWEVFGQRCNRQGQQRLPCSLPRDRVTGGSKKPWRNTQWQD